MLYVDGLAENGKKKREEKDKKASKIIGKEGRGSSSKWSILPLASLFP